MVHVALSPMPTCTSPFITKNWGKIQCQFVIMLFDFFSHCAHSIVGALPTIAYALEHGAKAVVLMSHLGRPDGTAKPEFTLKGVAVEVEKLRGEAKTLKAENATLVEVGAQRLCRWHVTAGRHTTRSGRCARSTTT